ncbi:VOC family protein [Neorhizobium sp. NCHU2750]|uniref:VOC family protein n=1 Tax=Neorhizobium sp. NCHU2750 TaxID=1825976 RepID=UPI000E725575|nr:glyoxalase [Neorhizobium sp. NCHU2750]
MLQTASKSRSTTHGKFIWCELMTSDTAAAGAFYSAVIGWQVNAIRLPDLPPYFLFEIGEGDNCPGIGGMMGFPPELDGKLPPNWTGYVAVDDVDETCVEYEALGGRIQRQPDDIPGIGRFAVVADPHGAVVCIMTPIPPENPPREPGPNDVGNVGWRELYAGNGEEAFDFYASVFGWTRDHDFPMGDMGVYRIFAHAGQAIGGMMTKPPNVPVPCWSYYFNVEAIDAAIGRVNANGGTVVFGPQEVPGGSFIIQATDPQGAFFCLVAPRR